MGRRAAYLPTLDGWRAVAILAVAASHDALRSAGPLNDRWLYEYGRSGVDVFFAISGLLICTLLLREERRDGAINLRAFYLRRAFRILPPALAFLAFLLVLNAAGVLRVYPAEVLSSLAFLRNYASLFHLNHCSPEAYFTQHFWSLSVEEHFYLLLPALLVMTRRRGRVLGLSVLIVATVVHRALVLMHRPWSQVIFHTDTRLDCLLIPALLAVVVFDMPQEARFLRWLRFWPVAGLGVLGLIMVRPEPWWQVTGVAVLMPLMVLGSVTHPEGLLARVLEWAPLRFVGRLSYSLYLWQMIFMVGHGYGSLPLGALEAWPLNWVGSFVMALASYYLIEQPAIRLGRQWLRPQAAEVVPPYEEVQLARAA